MCVCQSVGGSLGELVTSAERPSAVGVHCACEALSFRLPPHGRLALRPDGDPLHARPRAANKRETDGRARKQRNEPAGQLSAPPHRRRRDAGNDGPCAGRGRAEKARSDRRSENDGVSAGDSVGERRCLSVSRKPCMRQSQMSWCTWRRGCGGRDALMAENMLRPPHQSTTL